ncbi:MAG TPA: LysM domain-containing protein, partial [Anaerolineae bacterium]|nr:LysM domain-containing protein [Anaerolineae bacterium]
MDVIQVILRRYGAHIVLIVGAIVLFVAAAAVPFDDLLDFRIMADQQDGSDVAEYGVLPENLVASAPADVPASGLADLSNVPILINNSLSPALDPFTFEGKKPQHQVITYTVQANDTPIGIAEQFGINPETLLGGNAFLSEEASALQ